MPFDEHLKEERGICPIRAKRRDCAIKNVGAPEAASPAARHILPLYYPEGGNFYSGEDHAIFAFLLGHIEGLIGGGHEFVYIFPTAPCGKTYTDSDSNA